MNFKKVDIRRYSIESGIPIAPDKYAKRTYPFGTMAVGESFALEDNSWQEVDRVRAAVQEWQRRHAPMRFAVRLVDKEARTYRCWRTS